MDESYLFRAFELAKYTLFHRVESTQRRLGFTKIMLTDAEVVRRVCRTIQAMEDFGKALEAYAPEMEIPWKLCLRWRLLKLRQSCSQRIRHFLAPGNKQFKGSTHF